MHDLEPFALRANILVAHSLEKGWQFGDAGKGHAHGKAAVVEPRLIGHREAPRAHDDGDTRRCHIINDAHAKSHPWRREAEGGAQQLVSVRMLLKR